MPVTKVIIENFKGIRDQVEIPIRPITLLFGGNSAGKSTILHALLYFREILENQNVDADVVTGGGQDISLGGFRELVHEHNESSRVTLGVELDIADDGLQPYPVFESRLISNETRDEQLDEAGKERAWASDIIIRDCGITEINSASIFVTVGIPKSESTPKVLEYRVEINGILFAKISGETRLMTAIEDINTRHPAFSSFDIIEDGEDPYSNVITGALEQALEGAHETADRVQNKKIIPIIGNVVPTFGSALEFELAKPDDNRDMRGLARLVINQLLVRPGEILRNLLREYRHLGPIRAIPNLANIAQRSSNPDRWIDGMAAWDLLSQDSESSRTLTEQVDRYLKDKEHLDLGYSLTAKKVISLPVDSSLMHILQRFSIAPDEFDNETGIRAAYAEMLEQHPRSEIVITDLRRDVPVKPSAIGSGVSQVVPVLVSVLDPNSKITAIEQPELHLHPAVQCALGDLFIRATNESDERFFLIESHSEHILLRLMRRIRETQQQETDSRDLQLDSSGITILFVETYEGRSIYREMPLDEHGDLVKAWPGGFFEEDLKELM